MTVRILTGDCRERLAELPDQSVHCCVSSPPYFGLRDYGVDGQMGLEPTPDEFVAGMVAVFREVRRVLRDDGTLWLNIGDSYATQGGKDKTPHMGAIFADRARGQNVISRGKRLPRGEGRWGGGNNPAAGLLKSKDLIGIPWLLAFALRADGWYLRQDIIWSKPNPMPESVRDRCTKAHEYLFLLSKGPRYFFDAEAIAEESIWASDARNGAGRLTYDGKRQGAAGTGNEAFVSISDTRNKRSVWTVATQPFSEAHFATFPPDLIEPCILAGCPESVCADCGAPWVRVIESSGVDRERNLMIGTDKALAGVNEAHRLNGKNYVHARVATDRWSPSCNCNAAKARGTVLDPFGGAGTTGLVADRLQRNAILIELNPDYAAIAERRLHGDAGMFAEVQAA